MNTPRPPELRWCVKCGEHKPLDAAHFGRRAGGSVFGHTCKVCAQRAKYRVVAPIQDGRGWS